MCGATFAVRIQVLYTAQVLCVYLQTFEAALFLEEEEESAYIND